MGTNRQTLLHDLPTVVAFLRGETRIDSYHLMTGSCSLILKNSEKRAPTGVQDALCQGMMVDHVEKRQLLNSDQVIVLGVLVSNLEMMVTALTLNLQMCPGNEASSLTASMTAFLPPAQLALLPSQDFLRGAIEPRIRDSVALRVGQEGLESHINADVSMRTVSRSMLIGGLSCADDQRVPVPIGTMHQIDRFRLPLDGAVQLDLERLADLSRDNQVLLIRMQGHILLILSQLERVPAIGRFEPGETDALAHFLAGEIAFEGFGETVCKSLYGGGRHMLPTTSLKLGGQLILARECALLSILCFDGLQHLIIQLSSLRQTMHEQATLCFIWIQTILECSHRRILSGSLERVTYPPAGGRQFTHTAKASGPLAAYW